jgi:hypothetical protein
MKSSSVILPTRCSVTAFSWCQRCAMDLRDFFQIQALPNTSAAPRFAPSNICPFPEVTVTTSEPDLSFRETLWTILIRIRIVIISSTILSQKTVRCERKGKGKFGGQCEI